MVGSCILVDLKFKWGRHCSVVRSIAHCAVDRGIWLALPYTQRIAYLYTCIELLRCAAAVGFLVFYIGGDTLAIPIVVFYTYRL